MIYHCQHCSFVTDDEEEFQDHICEVETDSWPTDERFKEMFHDTGGFRQ